MKCLSVLRQRTVDSARIVRLIETKSARGSCTREDPMRIVTQYWGFKGNLLAENDPLSDYVPEVIPSEQPEDDSL